MCRKFNTDGCCNPKLHYMVDLTSRLRDIKEMVDAGKYFTINRARQYGKTTTLTALEDELKEEYNVISLDFQGLSSIDFESERNFVAAFSRQILFNMENIPAEAADELRRYSEGRMEGATLSVLFISLSDLCRQSEKGIVMLIDEVDSAANNRVFLDFLAQLRYYYMKRMKVPTFRSVILAGVHDIRSVKKRFPANEDHKENSPWNIAADFLVDMSFSSEDIAGMILEYEEDHHTGMNVQCIANMIYEYTAGYPYLVSRFCNYMDDRIVGTEAFPSKSSAWTIKGFYEAEKMIVKEDNSLYQSLIRKINLCPELRTILYELLFTGMPVPYTATNSYMKDAAMYGFIKNENDGAVISNRIFESVLYNYFISEEFVTNKMYYIGVQEKNQFIVEGRLDVRRILEKFIETFNDLYGDKNDTFLEEVGRRYFILFLKPIINGIGSYSVESRTRNNERMDLVIYYKGEQNVIEIKIWRGNAYNERGEEQLANYLEYFHLKKGYMLSFNFNKKKEIGIREIKLGDKTLVEAVV